MGCLSERIRQPILGAESIKPDCGGEPAVRLFWAVLLAAIPITFRQLAIIYRKRYSKTD